MLDASHDVYIGVGSNLGNRLEHIHFAVTSIQTLSTQPIACSPVYETSPVDYTDQPNFMNMVIRACVTQNPLELLCELMRIEQESGRIRSIRYGPRTLDLDLLLYDNSYYCYQSLQVPHPRMWERAFVMVPLATLAPGHRTLGGETVLERSRRLCREGDVQYVGHFW